MRRPTLLAVLALALLGCGSWQRVGTERPPTPQETLTDLFDLRGVYARLGRLVGNPPLPFVATMATVAGPGDSAVAVVGISLENRALAFQRDDPGFTAMYRLNLTFSREGAPPIGVTRDETVRVGAFAETLRDDESVLFQQTFHLAPGDYIARVAIQDLRSGNLSQAERAVTIPHYAPGTWAAPILAYQVTGRATDEEDLDVLLNPRGTVSYGGDTLMAYVEGYAIPGPTDLPVTIIDAADSVVYRGVLPFQGGKPVEAHVLRIAPDSQPLGELTLAVGEGDNRRTTRALVSFSQAWVITNFDDMLGLLRYFGEDERIAELRAADPGERPALWRQFYRDTDPVSFTPENEALETYFSRIAIANQRFGDEGTVGWRTDRGEVYVTLGEPDEGFITTPTPTQGEVIRWTYLSYRLTVYFQNESGFGQYRLTTESRSDYERVLNRVRRVGK